MEEAKFFKILFIFAAIAFFIMFLIAFFYVGLYHQAIDYGAKKLVDCTTFLGISMELGNVTVKDIMNRYIDLNMTTPN